MINKSISKFLAVVITSIILLFNADAKDKNPAEGMWLQSQTAVIKIGVWDKLQNQRKLKVVTFVVTDPEGKEYRSKKHPPSALETIETIFPSDFDNYPIDASKYLKYSWKCLIGNNQIGEGEFYWGGGKASDRQYEP